MICGGICVSRSLSRMDSEFSEDPRSFCRKVRVHLLGKHTNHRKLCDYM